MSDLVRHDSAAQGGDSGAAFYRFINDVVYAAGILSATSSTDSYHAKWTQIPSNWGVTLETS